MRLFAGAPCSRVNDTGARLLHSVGCLYVRSGAAVSGCLCDRLSRPPSVRLSALLHLVSRSGGQIRRSGGGRAQSGWSRLCLFCPHPSVHALLPASLRLFKSCQPESRKVESRQRVVSQSRQSRKSREVKSRKSRKGRDIRVPTCVKVVKS